MEKRDGGPAFPNDANKYGNDGAVGMSLRDYAAIHMDVSKTNFSGWDAVTDFLGEPRLGFMPTDAQTLSASLRATARLKYMAADAMLAERGRVS